MRGTARSRKKLSEPAYLGRIQFKFSRALATKDNASPKYRIGTLGISEEIFYKVHQWDCEDSIKLCRAL